MILTALLASAALLPQGEPITLARKFQKGEKLEYLVSSSMTSEYRGRGLETWMPSDYELKYRFTTHVVEQKPDGIVDLSYKRPTVTEIQGQTMDSGPKEHTEKLNLDFLLTVSPVNEILNMKDMAKKPPVKKGAKGDDGDQLRLRGVAGSPVQIPFLGQFISEVYRLALFTGSFDSALDFAPRLPLDKVKVGDTWQKTVGYSPQKLKGKDGKSAVQRLDYTYTYKGVVAVNGKQFQRVQATLKLDTDINDFINQTYSVTSSDTGLKTIPLNLKATIDFNLDMATHRTVYAVANSEGGFKIILTDNPESAVQEQKFKGSTEMKLVSVTTVAAPKTGAATPAKKGGTTRKRGG
jgi:hypothetical protein